MYLLVQKDRFCNCKKSQKLSGLFQFNIPNIIKERELVSQVEVLRQNQNLSKEEKFIENFNHNSKYQILNI
jgi:hypothetical protein